MVVIVVNVVVVVVVVVVYGCVCKFIFFFRIQTDFNNAIMAKSSTREHCSV